MFHEVRRLGRIQSFGGLLAFSLLPFSPKQVSYPTHNFKTVCLQLFVSFCYITVDQTSFPSMFKRAVAVTQRSNNLRVKEV